MIHTPFESVKKLDALRTENNFTKRDHSKNQIPKTQSVTCC